MRNPFKRREKALTGTSEVISAMNSGWSPIPILGGGARDRIQNQFNRAQSANYGWMYAHSPAVRTVIDVIVRNVGGLELRLFEEVSQSERNPRPDHPAALSLRYPNETTAQDQLVRSVFKDFLIYDNAYVLLVPAAGNRITLERIPAYMVEVKGPSLFQADIYRVWPQGAWTNAGTWGGFGTPIDFTADQILHWHGEHPLDPRVGVSHLDTLRDVVAEDASLQQATVELANSGLQEPTWAFRPLDAPEWSNEARAGFEEDLSNRLRGRNRKPVVLEEGMEIRSFGVSPQDAQMLEVRRWAVERVATSYGVPLATVGLGTGRAENLADAQAQLYTDTLLPICQNFSKTLDQRILVQAYHWTDGTFEFSFDEKLMGNDRLTALTTASGRPVMLTNEARAKLNLPPVDGGDELVTPANVLVGDNPLPSQGVMPIQDPNKPPQDGSYRLPPAKTLEPGRLPQLHPARRLEMDRQRRNVDLAQAAVERHLTRIERQLKAIKRKALKATAQDWERWDLEGADDFDRLISQIVDKEGSIYAFKLAGEFDMGRVAHYVRAMAEGVAKGINDNLHAEIDDLGLETAVSRHGAHVVSAGTSIGVAATTWAREEAARQSPGSQDRMKTWVADTDRHAEFDGNTVPLDADWPAGFAPGGAPNCACTAVIS